MNKHFPSLNKGLLTQTAICQLWISSVPNSKSTYLEIKRGRKKNPAFNYIVKRMKNEEDEEWEQRNPCRMLIRDSPKKLYTTSAKKEAHVQFNPLLKECVELLLHLQQMNLYNWVCDVSICHTPLHHHHCRRRLFDHSLLEGQLKIQISTAYTAKNLSPPIWDFQPSTPVYCKLNRWYLLLHLPPNHINGIIFLRRVLEFKVMRNVFKMQPHFCPLFLRDIS